MEPHRAPLGGEEHATEAHKSFHGDETMVGVHYKMSKYLLTSMQSDTEEVSDYPAFSGWSNTVSKLWSVLCLLDHIKVHLDIFV